MKKLRPQRHDVLYLATNRVMYPVKEPYKIQEQMIEMKNFVPEAFIIHQFQEYKDLEMECYDYIRVSKGDILMPSDHVDPNVDPDQFLSVTGDEDEDDDFDDDDDWDDDEEDEDWDEDDEDWDDDEDEDWDDEDEDWDDDVDEEEEEE